MAFTSKVSQVLKGRVNSGANQLKGFIDGAVGNFNTRLITSHHHLQDYNQAKRQKQKQETYLIHRTRDI